MSLSGVQYQRAQFAAASVIAIIIFAFILTVILMHPLRIAPEAALRLECAMLITQGKQPFVGFLDTGAAALMYLSLPPAVVHIIVPQIHPAVLFNVYVWFLSIGSTVLSGWILWNRRRHRMRWAFLPIVVSMAFSSLLVNVEFGQREHLFMLLLMPYILLRWLRNSGLKIGVKESRIAGVLAGIAYCLDPLFLIPFLALEAYFRLDKRSLKPLFPAELRWLLSTMLVYLVHFMLLPISLLNYFTCVVPLNLADYIFWDDRMEYLNAPLELNWMRWTSPDRRDVIYWMAAICTFSLGLRRKVSLLSPLVLLAIAGLLTYVVQGKALSYQALVVVVSCAIQGAILIAIALNGLMKFAKRSPLALGNTSMTPYLQAVILLVLVSGTAFYKTSWKVSGKYIDLKEFGYVGVADRADLCQFALKVIEWTKPGDPVIVLNDNVRAAYPLLLQINRVPGATILWGFPFRPISITAQEDSWLYTVFLGRWEAPLYEQLGQEIDRANAKVILIQSGKELDYLQNREIVDRVRAHYRLVGDLTWHDVVDHDVDTSNLELWGLWEPMQLYVKK